MKNSFVHTSEREGTAPGAGQKTLRRVGAVLLALALICSLGAIPAFAADKSNNAEGLVYTAERGELMNAAEVYAATVNSTVGITTSITTNYYGYETESAASGSGFIITADGYILTNYHVVEGSKSITVTTYEGGSYKAKLIGYDESNDIAVLKIDAEDLSPVTFGNSDELVVGQDVLAIGNPLGELTFSLTRGIVSALNREITLSGGQRMKLIQTDCAINSGNSGGALFNYYGEVVGVTNAKYSSSGRQTSVDNIGFAIPVNTLVGIVEQIMTSGKISTPYIGVTVTDVSEELTAYGIPSGALVYSVSEDSPAEKAGLREKDIITAVDGEEISSRSDLSDCVRSHAVGDKIELTVFRQGKRLELTVVIGENVKPALPEPEEEDESQGAANGNGGYYFNWPSGDGSGQGMPFDGFEDFFSYFG